MVSLDTTLIVKQGFSIASHDTLKTTLAFNINKMIR